MRLTLQNKVNSNDNMILFTYHDGAPVAKVKMSRKHYQMSYKI